MKIVFLNIWEGKLWKALSNFISESSTKADIFCFQEVPISLMGKTQRILPQFGSVFEYTKEERLKDNGQAVFVKKPLVIKNSESVFFYSKNDKDKEVGFLQKVMVLREDKSFLVGNLQGKAYPGNKLDTEVRLRQSAKILEAFSFGNLPKIIGGDFNLLPETKSIKMFEEAGYKNLIKDFKVSTTRSSLADYTKKDKHYFGKQYFADYVFTSSEVKANNFEVPDIEISDHLPLILEFEI